jgi:hypothetical protein
MTFGIAQIAAPLGRKRTGRTFFCGAKLGHLTARQIATIAGISREGVWQRVKSGMKGPELCAPRYESARKAKEKCSRPVMAIAMKLARAFPDKVPSVREIRKEHPMGARNAMRWRQAMNDANERRTA